MKPNRAQDTSHLLPGGARGMGKEGRGWLGLEVKEQGRPVGPQTGHHTSPGLIFPAAAGPSPEVALDRRKDPGSCPWCWHPGPSASVTGLH